MSKAKEGNNGNVGGDNRVVVALARGGETQENLRKFHEKNGQTIVTAVSDLGKAIKNAKGPGEGYVITT